MRGVLVARACRVADDRRQVHDRVNVAQRLGAGVGVANVGEEQCDALLAQPVRAAALAVQERVEHADVVRDREQLLGDQHADVAGSAGDEGRAPHALTLTRDVDPAAVVNDLVCANN